VCSSSGSRSSTSRKPGAPPGTDRALVPHIRVDRDPTPAACVAQVPRDRARCVGAKAPTARLRHEEHVDAAAVSSRPDLQESDRLLVRLDDERLHLPAAQPLEHLVAREALVVPVARHLGVVVPRSQEIRVALVSGANDSSLAAQLATCQVSSTADRNRAGAFSQ
jgi:hypothetical protein